MLQVVQDLFGSDPNVGLVVIDVPLLAETRDQLVTFLHVVPRHHGEEVVVDLVPVVDGEG